MRAAFHHATSDGVSHLLLLLLCSVKSAARFAVTTTQHKLLISMLCCIVSRCTHTSCCVYGDNSRFRRTPTPTSAPVAAQTCATKQNKAFAGHLSDGIDDAHCLWQLERNIGDKFTTTLPSNRRISSSSSSFPSSVLSYHHTHTHRFAVFASSCDQMI